MEPSFGKITKKDETKLHQYLKDENKKMMDRLFEAEHILDTTRAGKLLKKGKPFICVAIDEPYYPQVYRLIRQHEAKKGRWTEQDEIEFQKAISRWMEL